jgi:hypothetical protein
VLGRFVAVGPEKVASVIADALRAKRPKSRYVTPFNVRMLLAVRRLSGDRMWDALLRSQYPSPKPD